MIDSESMTVHLDTVGIHCTKAKDVQATLEQREKDKVDPFKSNDDELLHKFFN